MELESISIYKQPSYAPGYKEGSYRGIIKYSGQYGTVEVQLTPELSAAVLAIVADNIVQASRAVATLLTASVITQTGLSLDRADCLALDEPKDDIPF